ncbi:Uncharacterized protein PECH_000437 [Penicillium ucsense]|uniref:Cell surface protein n=1 Tax=Penicillium ucsense TaxID=2839758 RepID=A0A8J8WGN7_9EURO|nr:Uncharacterized protein PECM_008485 [Penicillium ucsense]KAF7733595.1 Uncharacterized protein PECH_000437 [Penicillium ucsense]
MSNLINKVKDAVKGHSDNSHEESAHSSNQGPHDSNTANKADPRVDSDRDGRTAHTSTTSSNMNPHHNTTSTGTSANAYDSTQSANYGPHGSNVANKADPRVDSDRDGRTGYGHSSSTPGTGLGSHSTTAGTTGTGLQSSTTGHHGSHHGTAAGVGSGLTAGAAAHEVGSHSHSANHGPHGSNVANKADPRIDSDRDGRASYGHNTTGLGSNNNTTTTGTGIGSHSTTGHHGSHSGTGVGTGLATGAATGAGAHEYGSHSTNQGPHDSNVANKADPRVDSDRDGRASYGHNATGTTGTGLQSSTSGTHGSHHGSHHGTSTGVGSGLAAGAAAHEVGSQSTHRGSNVPGTTGTGSVGMAGAGTEAGLTGHHGTMGGGPDATNSYATGPADNTAGPHKSDMANKADPRVDSDLSNSGHGFDQDVHKGSIGGAGVIPISGNAGPTSTKTFEEAQHAGSAGAGSSYNNSNTATTGSSATGQKTAGPHKSDMANKLDPRVDSDLDGSKTVGNAQQRA